ncbi:micronuclear linker histone polyprotein-like [Dermacentor albipictus]|uniref:micronuclear linker histone polyprotein-like n=1 Tax=Dermacentor albipictus TaxID=60249 RepID=UPI0031FCCA6B
MWTALDETEGCCSHETPRAPLFRRLALPAGFGGSLQALHGGRRQWEGDAVAAQTRTLDDGSTPRTATMASEKERKPAERAASPPKTRRATQRPAAADNDRAIRAQEAPSSKRARGNASKDAAASTRRPRLAKPIICEKSTTTTTSRRTRKPAAAPPRESNPSVPSTSKGMASKAPKETRKKRSTNASSSPAASGTSRTVKRGYRSVIRSSGSCVEQAQGGRGGARHASRTSLGAMNGKVSSLGRSSSASESSRGRKTRQSSKCLLQTKRNSYAMTADITRSGTKRRRQSNGLSPASRLGKQHRSHRPSASSSRGRPDKARKAVSSSSATSGRGKRKKAGQATK